MVTLNFTICESSDRTKLQFHETTGAYSASNTSGWGNPNKETTDAEICTLTVTTPAGTTTTLNLFTSSFPTTDSDQEFEILNTDLGLSSTDKLLDGVYTCVYTVARTTSVSFSYTQTKTVYIFGQMQCSVYSLFGKIPTEECTCNTDAMELAFKASTFLNALCHSATDGNALNFNKILSILERLTSNNNCKNC